MAIPPLSRTKKAASAKASRERNDGRQLLDVDGVGEYIGKSKWTVYRLIESGELRSIKVGRSLRVRPSDVDDYLERHMAS